MSKRRRLNSDITNDQQVLYNLITNALTFFEDGAMILSMIKEKTVSSEIKHLAGILHPLFGLYRDEMMSALPPEITSSDDEDVESIDSIDDDETVAITVSLRATAKDCNDGIATVYAIGKQQIKTEKGESLFAWLNVKGELGALGIQECRTIKDEATLFRWLEAGKGVRGALLICSGGGIGGFSDKIVYLLKNYFHLPNFAELVGDEAYIGISTILLKQGELCCEGTEEISKSGFLTKEIVLRF